MALIYSSRRDAVATDIASSTRGTHRSRPLDIFQKLDLELAALGPACPALPPLLLLAVERYTPQGALGRSVEECADGRCRGSVGSGRQEGRPGRRNPKGGLGGWTEATHMSKGVGGADRGKDESPYRPCGNRNGSLWHRGLVG